MRLHYGNPFAPIQSLYAGGLQAKPGSKRAAGIFCKVTSGRALNRSPESRGSQTSGVLFGSFCTTQKERKNVPFAGSFEVPQTLIQRTKITTSCNPIKSFCRSAASSGGYAAFFVVCGNRSPPLATISSALRRCYVAIATFFLPPSAASFFVAAATNFAAF